MNKNYAFVLNFSLGRDSRFFTTGNDKLKGCRHRPAPNNMYTTSKVYALSCARLIIVRFCKNKIQNYFFIFCWMSSTLVQQYTLSWIVGHKKLHSPNATQIYISKVSHKPHDWGDMLPLKDIIQRVINFCNLNTVLNDAPMIILLDHFHISLIHMYPTPFLSSALSSWVIESLLFLCLSLLLLGLSVLLSRMLTYALRNFCLPVELLTSFSKLLPPFLPTFSNK